MKKFVIIAVVLALGIGAYIFLNRSKPISSRDAIEQTISQKEEKTPLDKDSKELLRLQLALKDYTIKTGEPPETLSQLIPDYFDTLPIDPQTKAPYKYKRDGTRTLLGAQVDNPDATILASANIESGTEGSSGKTEPQEFINPNEIKQENFVYDPTNKRDPFKPFNLSPEVESDGPLTPLQKVSISQLRLTAVLSSAAGDMTAFVEDSSGQGYSVKVGTKIGPNRGEVVEITSDKIKILETKVDFTGAETQNVVEMKIQTSKDRMTAKELKEKTKKKDQDKKKGAAF